MKWWNASTLWVQLGLLITGGEASAQTDPPSLPAPATPAAISFEVRQGHIMVPLRINNSEPLSFMLDTGYSMSMIHPELAETLQLRRTGHVTIVGIAGEEEAAVFEGATFDLSGATYAPRRIASLPSEGNRRRRRKNGILGSGFFRRFVVEIDSQAKTLRLYEPRDFQYAGQGEVIPLKFRRDTPVIEASINIPGQPPVKGEFEMDTGCNSALCLGHDFVEAHKLIERSGQTSDGTLHGVGGSTSIREGYVPQFQMGRFKIDKLAANFFQEGSPADRGLAGHIGFEALRRFKVIFDYSRRQMILEASSSTNTVSRTEHKD